MSWVALAVWVGAEMWMVRAGGGHGNAGVLDTQRYRRRIGGGIDCGVVGVETVFLGLRRMSCCGG